MPVEIRPNGEIGQRIGRTSDVKRLRGILQDLQAAFDGWDTLTAGQRNAALKLVVRAVMVLVRYQVAEIRARSRG
jgi:hypothetical protein